MIYVQSSVLQLHVQCVLEEVGVSFPADDVIYGEGHSFPEADVPRVVWLQLSGHLFIFTALVEPPKLITAEQVGLAVIGRDEGSIHPVHWYPTLCPHSPFRQGLWVTVHGHRVLEDPVLRSDEEDDTTVTLPLIHSIDLVCSWRKADPEVFDLSRIQGDQRPVLLGPPEVITFKKEDLSPDIGHCVKTSLTALEE